MAEDSVCAICVEDYRDPVKLPCGHTYCRECLTLFVERSKTTSKEKSISSQDKGVTISCPICRAPTYLDADKVASLSPACEFYKVPKRASDNVSEAKPEPSNQPLCSMCEDQNNKAPAVKYCLTCVVLYCEGCLASLHPMRGPLGRHSLIGVEEYVPERVEDRDEGPIKGESTPDKSESDHLTCEQHNQRVSMYCVTCQEIICIGCLTDHNQHKMSDIESAYETVKKPLLEKTEACRELKNKVERCAIEKASLMGNIQAKKDLHVGEVDKIYNRKLEALNSWRKQLVDSVTKWHEQLYTVCQIDKNNLQKEIGQMEMLMKTSHELMAASKTVFLRDSGQLMSRINDQIEDLTAFTGALKLQERANRDCRSCMTLDPVTTAEVLLGDVTINPTLEPCLLDEESLNSKICTFTITQEGYMGQHWYHCHTCKMEDGIGVCIICAKVCHKDHDLTYAKYSSFFCDCGAKDDDSCQALVERNCHSCDGNSV